MHRIMRALPAALMAVAVLVAWTGSVSARNLSVDEREFELRWKPESNLDMIVAMRNIHCPITLRGSFVGTTFAKTTSPAVGRITSVTENQPGCAGEGGARWKFKALPSTPWEMRYESFTGRLPNIGSIRIRLTSGGFELLEPNRCAYPFETGTPFQATIEREAGGRLTTIVPESGAQIPSTTVELFCMANNATFTNFSVRGVISRRETETQIGMTLI